MLLFYSGFLDNVFNSFYVLDLLTFFFFYFQKKFYLFFLLRNASIFVEITHISNPSVDFTNSWVSDEEKM